MTKHTQTPTAAQPVLTALLATWLTGQFTRDPGVPVADIDGSHIPLFERWLDDRAAIKVEVSRTEFEEALPEARSAFYRAVARAAEADAQQLKARLRHYVGADPDHFF